MKGKAAGKPGTIPAWAEDQDSASGPLVPVGLVAKQGPEGCLPENLEQFPGKLAK